MKDQIAKAQPWLSLIAAAGVVWLVWKSTK